MASHFIPRLLSSQLFGRVPSPTADFSGQTIIVTGSNTGLGLEAARHIARLGAAKVILGVRTVSKGEAAADDISKTCNVPRSRIEVWELSMNDHASITSFAKRAQNLNRLDGAVLNAGIMQMNSWSFFDKTEAHIAVNVIGTMLLAYLLLPKLQHSAKQTGLRARLAIVGSDIMMMADKSEIEVDGPILAKLNNVANQKPSQGRYCLSKLLVKYSVQALADRHPLSASNVVITDLTPGMCKSDLFREDNGVVFQVFSSITQLLLAHTTEEGSRTLVYGVEPDLPAEAHGAFLWDNKVSNPGPLVTGDDAVRLAKKWNQELLNELERISPGCTRV